MTELRAVVEQCVERQRRHRERGQLMNEQNTKAALIDPVLGALGWDLYDTDEVHREYKRVRQDNPVDYALLLLRTPRLFIEAKALGENLDDPRWANQTISYATMAGVEWVALTNGAEWRVYNAHAPVPIDDKLFRAVRLEDDIDAAVDLLCLLSKQNMGDNRIEELWKSFFVDRQVHAKLRELFAGSEPAPDLVDVLDTRMPKLSREEIRQSLVRARATFDFPTSAAFAAPVQRQPPSPQTYEPSVPQAVPRPAPAASAHHLPAPARPNRQAVPVTPDERRLKLVDLMSAGRLKPGTVLHGRYLRERHTAELLADGRIRYRGEVYNSPSGAGEAVKIAIHGADISDTRKATDGFDFWQAQDAVTGDVVTLKEIRRRVAQGRQG
ncbi:restriction system modified-DNA reader domain-containing protein [Micromonospora globbae]|uniref:restriction system modified-DNA reader domain-containing protein n=1 Tax=Micromonospora globbae TaxID=1894969 RepID=UPI003789F5A3